MNKILATADDATLIAAMVATPKLIERPIVTDGEHRHYWSPARKCSLAHQE